MKDQFEGLFGRQGRPIGDEVKTEYKQNAKVGQQKDRRIPMQLQEAVQEEINRLLNEGHIEGVTEVTKKHFIQPVVIKVKRYKCVKSALDARALYDDLVNN